ncbi:MAG: DMT family transporter [Ruminococcaceae bacterium]|nr:DMT family transporter [Oscillospiraceae bacterium]
MGILVAILSGALMSLQGVFNEGVTKQTSIWVSASFVQLTAFLFCIAAWLFTGRDGSFSGLFNIQNKYMLLGGIMGALITYTVVRSMSSLGPAGAVMIIVTAQILVAYLIELFGLFGTEKVNFEWSKILGVALAIGGIILFKK